MLAPRPVLVVLLVAFSVTFAACGDDDLSAPDPVVSIVQPADGAVITSDAELVFEVQNFNVLPNQAEPNASGEGHLHIFLNGAYTSFSSTDPVRLADLGADGTLAPGNHEITIQLVNNDHTSIEADSAVTTISVTVTE